MTLLSHQTVAAYSRTVVGPRMLWSSSDAITIPQPYNRRRRRGRPFAIQPLIIVSGRKRYYSSKGKGSSDSPSNKAAATPGKTHYPKTTPPPQKAVATLSKAEDHKSIPPQKVEEEARTRLPLPLNDHRQLILNLGEESHEEIRDELWRRFELQSDEEPGVVEILFEDYARSIIAELKKMDDEERGGESCWMILPHLMNGKVSKARALYDEMMPISDGGRWTELMIAGYAWKGKLDEARRLFDGMEVKTLHAWRAIINGYVINDNISEARRLFDEAPEDEKDHHSLLCMVKGYVGIGKLDEARIFFDSTPPKKTSQFWSFMIKGYLKDNNMSEPADLFEAAPLEQREVSLWDEMVCGFAKKGMLEEAKRYFDNTPKRTKRSWNAMIRCCINKNYMAEARSLFDRVSSLGGL